MNMMKYKLSTQLYKTYNGFIVKDDWTDMNFQQNFNSRLNNVQINDYPSLRIGKNILLNRLGVLNNEIPYDWLNFSLVSFKLKCKNLYLTNAQ